MLQFHTQIISKMKGIEEFIYSVHYREYISIYTSHPKLL